MNGFIKPKGFEWQDLKECEIFYDADGATWQIQMDFASGQLVPVLIQQPAKPFKLATGKSFGKLGSAFKLT